ncbi:MAG: hypothetical protein ACHQZQ_02565 [SAR324 cluster bacterium]
MLKRVLTAPALAGVLAGLTVTLWAGLPTAPAFGQVQRPHLAVMRLDAFSFAPVPAAQMTDVFRNALADTGAFRIIAPDVSTNVSCQDLSCALAVGRQAKANLVVYGDIAELDPGNWLISATLASVDSGDVIRAIALDQAGSPTTQFPTAFKTLAYRLVGMRADIATAAAEGKQVPAHALRVGERRAAIFPVMNTTEIAGNAPAMNAFVGAFRAVLPELHTLAVDYVFDDAVLKRAVLAVSQAYDRPDIAKVKSLKEDRLISGDSWLGVLNRTPNEELGLKKCDELDVDIALFVKLSTLKGGQAGNQYYYYQLFLVDANRRDTTERAGWYNPNNPAALRQALMAVLRQ